MRGGGGHDNDRFNPHPSIVFCLKENWNVDSKFYKRIIVNLESVKDPTTNIHTAQTHVAFWLNHCPLSIHVMRVKQKQKLSFFHIHPPITYTVTIHHVSTISILHFMYIIADYHTLTGLCIWLWHIYWISI